MHYYTRERDWLTLTTKTLVLLSVIHAILLLLPLHRDAFVRLHAHHDEVASLLVVVVIAITGILASIVLPFVY